MSSSAARLGHQDERGRQACGRPGSSVALAGMEGRRPGAWENDFLNFKRRVLQKLLQICVVGLIGGYGDLESKEVSKEDMTAEMLL